MCKIAIAGKMPKSHLELKLRKQKYAMHTYRTAHYIVADCMSWWKSARMQTFQCVYTMEHSSASCSLAAIFV
jgi:hypothetical protein